MNYALKQLAIFIRDLLVYDENLIRLGRQNFEREQFETGYIVVDGLGADLRVSSGNSYNGNTEVQTIGSRFQKPCTINFYGSLAYETAMNFILMAASQKSHELQVAQGITVYAAINLTDVKSLTGQQYGENIELQLNLQYNQTLELSVLSIETAQFSILTETGEEPIT